MLNIEPLSLFQFFEKKIFKGFVFSFLYKNSNPQYGPPYPGDHMI